MSYMFEDSIFVLKRFFHELNLFILLMIISKLIWISKFFKIWLSHTNLMRSIVLFQRIKFIKSSSKKKYLQKFCFTFIIKIKYTIQHKSIFFYQSYRKLFPKIIQRKIKNHPYHCKIRRRYSRKPAPHLRENFGKAKARRNLKTPK